jgi:hypothetical protein
MINVSHSHHLPYLESSPSAQPQEPWRDAQISGMASRPWVALYPFCLLPLRLPLFCLGWRRSSSPSQFLVGEPLASDSARYFSEPFAIGSFAGVETETFFVQIPEKMERLNVDIGSCDSSLQETPEVLNAVGVTLATNVRFSVVNDFMNEVPVKASITTMGIGVDSGTRFNMATDCWGKGLPFGIRNYLSLNSAMVINSMPVEESHYYGFANSTPTLNLGFSLAFVHVPGLATNESFVNLNLAGHEGIAALHCQADTMEHEPSGLLGDSDCPVNLIRANAVFGIRNHPDSSEPLVKSDGAIFEDGSHLDGKLPLFMLRLAFPKAASGDESDIYASASRARYTIGPAEFDHEVKADVRVGEIFNSFDKGSWLAHFSTSFHCSKCTRKELLSQVYCCPY